MSQVQFFTVLPDESGQRLDNYLTSRLKGIPKSLLYRIIRKGEVRVNKGRAKPERKLKADDVVRVPPLRLAGEKAPVSVSANLAASLNDAILYDEGGLLILNKPSGIAVHGGSGVQLGLIEALRQLPEQKGFLELVHRLDKETSGCIMVARKRSVLKYLQECLREKGVIQKRYLALVHGVWPKHASLVDVPLKRMEAPNGDRYVKPHNEGKNSQTKIRIVQRYKDATLIEAMPLTGRTHQIRVHAKHVGHPLFGDSKYASDEQNAFAARFQCKRLFLHACGLSFKSMEGACVDVEAKLPAVLNAVLSGLAK